MGSLAVNAMHASGCTVVVVPVVGVGDISLAWAHRIHALST